MNLRDNLEDIFGNNEMFIYKIDAILDIFKQYIQQNKPHYISKEENNKYTIAVNYYEQKLLEGLNDK